MKFGRLIVVSFGTVIALSIGALPAIASDGIRQPAVFVLGDRTIKLVKIQAATPCNQAKFECNQRCSTTYNAHYSACNSKPTSQQSACKSQVTSELSSCISTCSSTNPC